MLCPAHILGYLYAIRLARKGEPASHARRGVYRLPRSPNAEAHVECVGSPPPSAARACPRVLLALSQSHPPCDSPPPLGTASPLLLPLRFYDSGGAKLPREALRKTRNRSKRRTSGVARSAGNRFKRMPWRAAHGFDEDANEGWIKLVRGATLELSKGILGGAGLLVGTR